MDVSALTDAVQAQARPQLSRRWLVAYLISRITCGHFGQHVRMELQLSVARHIHLCWGPGARAWSMA